MCVSCKFLSTETIDQKYYHKMHGKAQEMTIGSNVLNLQHTQN
jgi:hypothetical protein